MATGVLVEPQTYSAKKFSDSFFYKQPIDLKYTSSRYHKFSPINSLTDATKIDFSLPAFSTPSVWDLDNSYIEVGYKITDENGNLPAITDSDGDGLTEYVAPVNNALHSMFKNVDLYFNDVLINLSGGFHHYKEYLKTLLSYNTDYKNTVLRSSGWGNDNPMMLNSVSNSNPGFWKRLGNIAKTDAHNHKIAHYLPNGGTLFGGLGLDYSGTPVINGINIRLQYTLNDPDFFIFGKVRKLDQNTITDFKLQKKYTYTLHKFIIHGLVHELQPSIYETLEARLRNEAVVVGFKRYNILQHSIPVGLSEWLSDSLLPSPDLTPNRIFFVLIKNDFYEPSQDNNPYQFGFKEGESNGILDFQITISGTDLDNLNSPNFDQMAYLRLQKYLGMANHGQTNSIDYEQFMNGSTVYVADFSTSLDSNQDYIIPSLKVGYVRLRIRFKEPTTEALHLLCMSEYNSTLSIENGKTGRIVKTNYFM